MSTVTIVAAVAPLVWLGWLVLTDSVPMYPLNDLEHRDHHQRAVAAMTTYPAGLLISAGVLIGQGWSLATAVILAGSVVVGTLPAGGSRMRASASARSATSTGRSTRGP